MCTFFSFITTGDGIPIYFTAKDRQKLARDNPKDYRVDSHSSIAEYFMCNGMEDYCNKYEYTNGGLIVDQINAPTNDKVEVKTWIREFVKTLEFRDICMAAVQQNGWALQYVKEQDKDICIAAVQHNGWALYHVKEQDRDICMAAVQQNGWALKDVKEQDKDICMAAVQQDGYALEHVKEQDKDICMAAVKQDGYALKYVKDEFKKYCKKS